MLCVGVKFIALSLCLSMIGVSLVIGQIWFSPTASLDDIRSEVSDGKDQYGKVLDLNATDTFGNTGVMRAVQIGDVKLLSLLIDNGADVNIRNLKDDDQTALHFAMYNGDSQKSFEYDGEDGFIKILLKNGADPRITDKNNRTPLHLIQEVNDHKKRLDVSVALIRQVGELVAKKIKDTAEQNAAIVDFINAQNRDGDTILHLASSGNDTPWIRVLQEAPFFCDIDFNIKDKEQKTALEASPTQEVRDAMDDFISTHIRRCKKRN